jgi:hypothetical protein
MATEPVKLDPTQNTVKLDPTQNTVKLDPANSAVKAEVTKLPTPVAVTQAGTVTVAGSVEVSKLPAVSGAVEVTKQPAVTGNVGVTSLPPVTGTVEVTKLPAVGGAVEVTKLPAVAGNVGVTSLPPVTGNVGVTSLPPVTGSVEVTKLPAQPAPVVNVPAPVVNVPAPVVNVPAPVVNVPAPVVNVPAPVVNVPEPKIPAPVVNVPAPVVNVPPTEFPASMRVTVAEPMPVAVSAPVELAGPLHIDGLFSERPGTLRYAVTQAGGRSGFGATTSGVFLDDLPTVPPGTEQSRDNPVPVVVALFVNPPDSGVDANLQRISLGSSGAGEWTRLGWPEEIELTGEPQPTINRGQGATKAKCALYTGDNGRGFNGRRAKTTFQKEWSTVDDEINGTIICRPGMSICWLFELSYGSGERVSVEVIWWETPAAADRVGVPSLGSRQGS